MWVRPQFDDIEEAWAWPPSGVRRDVWGGSSTADEMKARAWPLPEMRRRLSPLLELVARYAISPLSKLGRRHERCALNPLLERKEMRGIGLLLERDEVCV